MSAKILIIEDNATNLYLMDYLLKSFGYTVLTALDGEAGLKLAQREHPDLVICDIQMPVLDGYQVARSIRENPDLSHTRIVAVTAFAMAGDRDKALSSGFDNYLPKPIDPKLFASQIEGFLKQ